LACISLIKLRGLRFISRKEFETRGLEAETTRLMALRAKWEAQKPPTAPTPKTEDLSPETSEGLEDSVDLLDENDVEWAPSRRKPKETNKFRESLRTRVLNSITEVASWAILETIDRQPRDQVSLKKAGFVVRTISVARDGRRATLFWSLQNPTAIEAFPLEMRLQKPVTASGRPKKGGKAIDELSEAELKIKLRKEVQGLLKPYAKRIRWKLGDTLRARFMPEVLFRYDTDNDDKATMSVLSRELIEQAKAYQKKQQRQILNSAEMRNRELTELIWEDNEEDEEKPRFAPIRLPRTRR